MELGKVVLGGAVAAGTVAVLEGIDEKLAWWFTVITFMVVIFAQREVFFSQLNYLMGVLRGLK